MGLILLVVLYFGSLIVLTFDSLFDYADVMDRGLRFGSIVVVRRAQQPTAVLGGAAFVVAGAAATAG